MERRDGDGNKSKKAEDFPCFLTSYAGALKDWGGDKRGKQSSKSQLHAKVGQNPGMPCKTREETLSAHVPYLVFMPGVAT